MFGLFPAKSTQKKIKKIKRMFLSFPDTPSVPLAISHDARLWRPWLLEKGESQGFFRGFNELLGNAKNQKNPEILEKDIVSCQKKIAHVT